MSEPNREEFKVEGDSLVSKIKELVHEGNVRRIIIKDDEGRTIMELPLSVGVLGAVLLPIWVALGAIAALAAHYTIIVEREQYTGPPTS
jgi:hypothetical protein